MDFEEKREELTPGEPVWPEYSEPQPQQAVPTKFCKFCGAKIPMDAVVCTACGRQVELLQQQAAPQPNIVINNANVNDNVNVNTNDYGGMGYGGYPARPLNKWVALLLCVFTLFGHKFYEGKIGMGIIYLFTAGLFGIGWIVDIIALLCKPNPYYLYR